MERCSFASMMCFHSDLHVVDIIAWTATSFMLRPTARWLELLRECRYQEVVLYNWSFHTKIHAVIFLSGQCELGIRTTGSNKEFRLPKWAGWSKGYSCWLYKAVGIPSERLPLPCFDILENVNSNGMLDDFLPIVGPIVKTIWFATLAFTTHTL